MASDDRKMSVAEFVDEGLLQEVNRLLLHPLGLALSVSGEFVDGEFVADAFGDIWDYRDDPGGIYYDGDYANLRPKAERVSAALEARSAARQAKRGYVVQPIDEDPKPEDEYLG
jgi:hypothetical protein